MGRCQVLWLSSDLSFTLRIFIHCPWRLTRQVTEHTLVMVSWQHVRTLRVTYAINSLLCFEASLIA